MRENGPVTVYGAIVGVDSIGQRTIIAKLSANIKVNASLVSVAVIGSRRIPPVSVLRLVTDFRECQLCLTVNLVIREASTGAILPLCNCVAVTGNPFYG